MHIKTVGLLTELGMVISKSGVNWKMCISNCGELFASLNNYSANCGVVFTYRNGDCSAHTAKCGSYHQQYFDTCHLHSFALRRISSLPTRIQLLFWRPSLYAAPIHRIRAWMWGLVFPVCKTSNTETNESFFCGCRSLSKHPTANDKRNRILMRMNRHFFTVSFVTIAAVGGGRGVGGAIRALCRPGTQQPHYPA